MAATRPRRMTQTTRTRQTTRTTRTTRTTSSMKYPPSPTLVIPHRQRPRLAPTLRISITTREPANDCRNHPLVTEKPGTGADAGGAAHCLGHALGEANTAGRHSGPVRCAGDRQDDLPGTGSAGG